MAAAGRAATGAGRLGVPRVQAAACRAMAMAQRLVGDSEEVRRWTERAIRSAASAHLPLAGLRARCVYLTGCSAADSKRHSQWLGHLRAALTRRPLPALLRLRIEEVSAKVEQTVDVGIQASGAVLSSAAERACPPSTAKSCWKSRTRRLTMARRWTLSRSSCANGCVRRACRSPLARQNPERSRASAGLGRLIQRWSRA